MKLIHRVPQDVNPVPMTRLSAAGLMLVLACKALLPMPACASGLESPAKIHVEDVALFYRVYDAAGGHPNAAQLQTQYLDRGSDGLHQFAKLRNITGARIAQQLQQHPETYVAARECLRVLPQVRERLRVALRKLRDLYPEASWAPVTIAIGRGKPVGVTGAFGVAIGLEALCAADSLNANVEDRFVHVIAHEYGHVEQLRAIADDEHPTVLQGSLVEGGAEFVAELISGEVSNAQLATQTRGRESQIENAFVADEDSSDLSRWLYNHPGTEAWPPDLGYWVGYRIVKTYYQRSTDKRAALRSILEVTDPDAFLRKSGWQPAPAAR